MAGRPLKGKALTILGIFRLLAVLNGIVLAYLVFSAWALLQRPSSSDVQAQTTIYLALLLAVGVSISYRIVLLRVIIPLRRLVDESYRIACQTDRLNEYLNVNGSDEISQMARAFNSLLKSQREAAAQLDGVNRNLLEVNQKVSDSIRYAALLQKSILPERQLNRHFGRDHFVIWLPRDTVGGDCYVFHEDSPVCMAGVVDCAGHGVPGAMMTMLAQSCIDRSIQQVGISSPAAILEVTNEGMSQALNDVHYSRVIATSMDAGLVSIDYASRLIRFSGAKISLYWSDGKSVQSIRGYHRSLCDRRGSIFQDHDLPMVAGMTYYLATDGILDQSGGAHGFGLGAESFQEWILRHATKTLTEQSEAFRHSLYDFMGDYSQRDDITIISFRLP